MKRTGLVETSIGAGFSSPPHATRATWRLHFIANVHHAFSLFGPNVRGPPGSSFILKIR
ncbi:hypothetical protein OE88DRAFT_1665768 [Heliocybe sulcata]|uniref:Uncharacterized protein n=1 Tax=Heliocybe sulcata TaxID=5364 RepID=A0A5C3MT02_9AGAM|nr:hypothetical protein OE88DRAFT_1665768 [Heliocybe sulcata]